MEEEEDYAQKPLLATPSSSTYDLVKKTGNFWTTTAHIITAVIGSGVLSLAWSVAQLGWIGGPVSMLIFAAVTVLSSWLLADCYRSPDPETGSIINHTYMQSVRQHLGGKDELACTLLQQIVMYCTAIAYVITSAISMRGVFGSREIIVKFMNSKVAAASTAIGILVAELDRRKTGTFMNLVALSPHAAELCL